MEDDNDKLEALVQARTAELSELTTYLHKMREDERRSLARELHDELGAILTAAKLDIAFIKGRCAQAIPELVPKCDRVAGMLDQGTALKRRLIDSLMPSTLEMLGLAPAARDLVETFAGDARVIVDAEIDEEIALPGEDALVLYRIIEEALSNIRKHASASHAWVELGRSGDVAHLLVRDDGRGFDPQGPADGFGLTGMRERVALLRGDLEVASSAGGTTISAAIPAP